MTVPNPNRPLIIHVTDVAYTGSTLTRAFERLGHRSILLDIKNPPVGRFQKVRRLIRRAALVRRIRLLSRHSPTILHIHYAYLGWIGILARKEYYLHCHGSDLRQNLQVVILGWMTRTALRRAKRVYVATPDLLPVASRICPDVQFLPNPLNLAEFSSSPEPSTSPLRVLSISRMDAEKGFPHVVTAIGRLSGETQMVFTAIRWGDLASSLGARPNLRLLEMQNHATMPSLIAANHIIVGQIAPSIGALGMSELESMASGRPVITYFNRHEAYAEPPPVVSVSSGAELADAILSLSGDASMRASLGLNARAWVEKYHSDDAVAQRLLRDYGIE